MLKRFLREDGGQTTVEYLLIIAVIVIVISVLGKGMKDNVQTVVADVFGGVRATIKRLFDATR